MIFVCNTVLVPPLSNTLDRGLDALLLHSFVELCEHWRDFTEAPDVRIFRESGNLLVVDRVNGVRPPLTLRRVTFL